MNAQRRPRTGWRIQRLLYQNQCSGVFWMAASRSVMVSHVRRSASSRRPFDGSGRSVARWSNTCSPPSRRMIATTTGAPTAAANAAPPCETFAVPFRNGTCTSFVGTRRSGRMAKHRPFDRRLLISAITLTLPRSTTSSPSPYCRFIQASMYGLRCRAAIAKIGTPHRAIAQAAMYQLPLCGTMITTPFPSSAIAFRRSA